MIKLKYLLYEAIERASQFDASKIYWKVNDTNNSLYVRMYIKGYEGNVVYRRWGPLRNRELFGAIHLSNNDEGQEKGYLVIYNFQVEEPKKGYGKIIFRKALEEAKKLGYSGIASQKEFRSTDAAHLWDKVRNFSDSQFDYTRVPR